MVRLKELYKVYGIINDRSIKKVEIILANGDTLLQEDFYDNMFLIPLETVGLGDFSGIRAYDEEGNIVFESLLYQGGL